MELMKIFLTVGVGILGWQAAKKLKLPAAAMLGSLIAVAIMNVIFGGAYMPKTIKIFTQSIAGMFIGLQLRKEDLGDMKKMIKPILLLLGLYTVNTFVVGTLIHLLSGVDLLSSWLSCVAGGITDISLIAMDLNANLSAVVFLQSARLVFTIGCFPYWIKWLTKGYVPEEEEETEAMKKNSQGNMPLTIVIAVAGGFFGSRLGIPAGTIIFSMLAIAIVNNMFNNLYSKKQIKFIAQIFSGALIGSTVTLDMVLQLKTLFIPIVILMSGYLLVNFIFGQICYRKKWIDYYTALFCACPAGVSDLVLLAGELGADMKKTGVIHIVRLVYATALMPNLIILLVNLVA